MFARLGELRDALTEATNAQKKAKDEHDQFQHAVFQYMKDRGTTSYGTEQEQWVRKSTRYASITNRDAFLRWAEENGQLEEFTLRKEVQQRLNELVRTLCDDNQELPPGVDTYEKEYVSRTSK